MLKATHTRHTPWTLIDFNDQKRDRLTLIRDLLDRLPDIRVDAPVIEWKALGHAPDKEKFGVIKPIAAFKG